MEAASLPLDESDRLAALVALNILDTGPDPRFDRIVRLAADLFSAPIATVSLLDADRQWFKASTGIANRQTARDISFCAHAILDPDTVLVVEDALEDHRFARNPLVLGKPGIRFYAGAPVRAPSGHAMGTLCVIDRKPRTMHRATRRRLQDLAEGVSALFELHQSTQALTRSVTHDALTGLPNNASFDHRLEHAVIGALTGRPCALLLLDLDLDQNLVSQLHNEPGVDTRAAYLREAADKVSATLRAGDYAARIGGNEFAVILAEPAGRLQAEEIASRMQARLAACSGLPVENASSLVSIGIALSPLDATEAKALKRIARQSLLQADSGAFRHAESFQNLSRVERSARQELDADLRIALETNALQLHWQPVFAARDLEVCGFEALARWTHPGRGPVSPGIFIPVAEASDQIDRLDRWAINTACSTAAKVLDTFHVSVNLSPHWFGGFEVVDLVASALGRSGLAPHRLCLEITERSVIADLDLARNQIDALHRLGVRVALDDFGTGFSSLAYLRDLPFDVLKLDRSFVLPLGTSERSSTVACAIIRLGQCLGMTVCAEGVETEAQLRLLRDNGCDQLQGYLLGRPGLQTNPAACSVQSGLYY